MAGLCADCTACCTVFEIKEIGKAFGEPCKHAGATPLGVGCRIYSERPAACQRYVCLWLDSQRRMSVERMPEELRPNVCGVVLGWPWGLERDVLYVYPLPGQEGKWRIPPVSDHLKMVLSRGGRLMIVEGGKRIAIKGDMAVIGTEEEFETLLH